MNNNEKDLFYLTDALCTSITELYTSETKDSAGVQISYIIKRANLPTPVVLGALYLAVIAREKASDYVNALTIQIERHPLRKETLQKRIDACLQLCKCSTVLFSISFILSSKYLVDRSYINRTWSNILMLDRSTINTHERILLSIFDYQIILTEEMILSVLDKLQKEKVPRPKKKDNRVVKLLKRIISCIFNKKEDSSPKSPNASI
ncbi:hypothetical protein NEOKW01_1269 [Nematocida sp. AWRm80]|nr:hypothetical protein NEOKW01_1269 [Nematocida sp. AWRm80]